MSGKRIFGILVLICGIVFFCISIYITNQTEQGKTDIANAQKKVDQGNSLFSLNPIAKEVGKGIMTDPAQKKLNEANQEVAQYESLAGWFKIGGIALIVLGTVIVIFGRKK
jgi:hypothetical protein